MKTNFEQWRDGLTVESFNDGDDNGMSCDICPVKGTGECTIVSKKSCIDTFTEWASQPADEPEQPQPTEKKEDQSERDAKLILEKLDHSNVLLGLLMDSVLLENEYRKNERKKKQDGDTSDPIDRIVYTLEMILERLDRAAVQGEVDRCNRDKVAQTQFEILAGTHRLIRSMYDMMDEESAIRKMRLLNKPDNDVVPDMAEQTRKALGYKPDRPLTATEWSCLRAYFKSESYFSEQMTLEPGIASHGQTREYYALKKKIYDSLYDYVNGIMSLGPSVEEKIESRLKQFTPCHDCHCKDDGK